LWPMKGWNLPRLYLSQRDILNKVYNPEDLDLLTKADNFLKQKDF
jgi:hypothetical protein